MNARDIATDYGRWLEMAHECPRAELEALAADETALEDAFFRDLAFGTGGLRGIIGPGPNRMNVYTVAKATQGLADYLNARCESPSVAIAHDSRLMGDLFMRVAGEVLAANGVHAHLYPRVEPTPALSFAVRDLSCNAGICITASHNPAEYNGYKVYGSDGCQITTQAARDIQAAIAAVDIFEGVRRMNYYEAFERGLISWIAEDTLDRYIDAVAGQSLEGARDDETPVSVVYTPLNGTGLECFERIARRIGVTDVSVVPEQACPDGRFLTCPYPNPEVREALERGLELAACTHPDLLLATDPDADRAGIAVPNAAGGFELITGNELGMLLLDYICKMRLRRGEELGDRVVVTTIVSTTMADALARKYGFELRRTLTGFKYIGEQIGLLEGAGEAGRFIFGFEESYGYLSGSYVRDKDAIDASMLICEMTRHHKHEGVTLLEALNALYAEHGFYKAAQVSVQYPGASGAAKMETLMTRLREDPPAKVAGLQVADVIDYGRSVGMPVIGGADEPTQELPAADVLELRLEGDRKLIIRPSGTEPKVKAYVFAQAATQEESERALEELSAAARELLGE